MFEYEIFHSLIIKVQSHSMTDEVLSARLETEFLINSLHGVLIKIDTYIHDFSIKLIEREKVFTLVGSWVFVLPALQEFEKLLRPSLLK